MIDGGAAARGVWVGPMGQLETVAGRLDARTWDNQLRCWNSHERAGFTCDLHVHVFNTTFRNS